MADYSSYLRDLASDILDQYFPNREGVRVRVDPNDLNRVDFIIYMSDDDYLADVLVNGKYVEDVEKDIEEHICNCLIMISKVRLLKMNSLKSVYGNSNLIYAC